MLVFRRLPCRCVAVSLALLLATACAHHSAVRPARATEPFKIGVVLDFTGALKEYGTEAKNGALLALSQVNRAGGVLGRPMSLVFADGATDPEATVAAAETLVARDGVHALVGAMGSEATLRLAERVTVPSSVPTITPSATSPLLSRLDDHGYLFRATSSDAAQGAVLARLAEAEGYRRVAVLYRDDSYGRGLLESFTAFYHGEVDSRPIDPGRDTYLDLLREMSGDDALLAFTFPFEAEIFVSEAVENVLFKHFLFTDATRSLELFRRMGKSLEGMKGTAPALRTAAEAPSTAAFLAAYQEEFGEVPQVGPVGATYDSVICLALAAESAGSTDGAAIRDALPTVCGGGGESHIASPESVAGALDALRQGRQVNYDGASGTLDWDESGEVPVGMMDVWQFRDGAFASVERVPFDLRG